MPNCPSFLPAASIWRGTWRSGSPHAGSYAYAISNHAYGYLLSDDVAVQPNATYHLSVWLRGELDAEDGTGDWLLRAYYYDANHTELSYSDADRSDVIPVSWTERGGDFTTPANAAYIKIMLFSFMNSGWVAFDDVGLTGPDVTIRQYY